MIDQRKSLRFSLEKLHKLAKGDPIKLIEILENYYHGFITNLTGYSYLINAKDFFLDSTTDVLFKSQYLQLAARRSYQQYKDLGYKQLDLTYYPDLKTDTIKYNPLLTIKNNKIYFKYEE
jgi:hypothetical protein